jgi:GMP synthase-like glutamine amidotransferase
MSDAKLTKFNAYSHHIRRRRSLNWLKLRHFAGGMIFAEIRSKASIPPMDNAMTRKRLVFISQFAQPGSYSKTAWRRIHGGDDETVAVEALLDHIGVLDAVDYVGIKAHEGEALPDDLDAVDGVILGGSFASVSDDHTWQRAIAGWLGLWRDGGKPLMGICGGHQLMSTVLGGRVEKNPAGPTIGSLPVTRTEAGRAHYLFDGFDDASPFFFGNFDRVIDVPEGTTVLATRPSLPAAALDHGGGWVSVQFHPETTCDRMATCWAEVDPAQSARYSFIPGCERMIGNFLRGNGLV